MNLNQILFFEKIENLKYDTVFLEQPVADIVDFDYYTILPPPPSNTDNSTIKELELVAKKTKDRSKDDVELIYLIDQDIDSEFIKILDKYNIKYPDGYINQFYHIIRPILKNIKGIYNRPRPAQLGKLYGINIDLIVTDTIHTPSYPSGHTVYSSLVSTILQNLFLNVNKNQLDNVVEETAKARVMQGVHYPSDNAASIKLVKFLFNKLNPILRKDYDNALQ